jgi:hypothetical protein
MAVELPDWARIRELVGELERAQRESSTLREFLVHRAETRIWPDRRRTLRLPRRDRSSESEPDRNHKK